MARDHCPLYRLLVYHELSANDDKIVKLIQILAETAGAIYWPRSILLMSRHYSRTYLIFRGLRNKSKRIQWNSRQSVYCVRPLMDIQLICSGRSTFWLQITLLTAFLREKRKKPCTLLGLPRLSFSSKPFFLFRYR